MLPLDDPRWKKLDHRGWSKGTRSQLDNLAPFVPNEIEYLIQNPSDVTRFQSLWPYLCSEGTTWAAAYAAVPYLVEIAASLSPKDRYEYLVVIGLIVIDSCPESGPSFAIEPFLEKSYQDALDKVMPLLAESLLCTHEVNETRYLLSAAAALKGHPRLGSILEHLDCIGGDCPNCGEFVYPDEVQSLFEE